MVIARDYRKQWPMAISSSCFEADKLYLMRTNFYVRPGRPGCSGDQDERDQEEARPGEGGVSRVLNILIQTTPGGDTGGGVAGEETARVAITCPESEREERKITITCPEGEGEEQGVTITCPEGKEEEQRPTIQVSVSSIVHREAAAKQERVQPEEQ